MAEDSRDFEPDRRTAGKFEMDCAVFRPDRQQREYPAMGFRHTRRHGWFVTGAVVI